MMKCGYGLILNSTAELRILIFLLIFVLYESVEAIFMLVVYKEIIPYVFGKNEYYDDKFLFK